MSETTTRKKAKPSLPKKPSIIPPELFNAVNLPTFPVEIENFRLLKRIGQGRSAVVFLAEHLVLGINVALKIIKPTLSWDPEEIALFLNEARKQACLTASLRDPGICQIYESGLFDDHPYTSMHFIDGGTLHTNAPKSPRDIAPLFYKMATTLAKIHEQGIVHLDLKPSNILIDSDGQPVIADFGISRNMESVRIAPEKNEISGTPNFMSPEQWAGTPGIQSDVFSLGKVLNEVLDNYEYPEQLDQRLIEIAKKATAIEPAKRFSDMKSFADALKSLMEAPKVGEAILALSQPLPARQPTRLSLDDLHFAVIGPGSVVPRLPQPRNRLFLDVGNDLCPGILDHHQGPNVATSATQLVVQYPDFVLAAIDPLRKQGDKFFLVLPDSLSFDALASAYLSVELLVQGQLPRNARVLANYANLIDSGETFPDTNNPFSLYAAILYLVTQPIGDKGMPHNLREAASNCFELFDWALKRQLDGKREIHEINSLDCPIFNEDDRRIIHGDRLRYEAKLLNPNCKAQYVDLLLPSNLGGFVQVDCLFVRDVQNIDDSERCMFFKNWARSDSVRAPREGGFVLLSVYHSASLSTKPRCIISLRPDSKATLFGLASLLEHKECAKRKELHGGHDDRVVHSATGEPIPFSSERVNSDPWYDGRGHNFTIVDSPRAGTVLTADEIESTLWEFSGGK